MQKQINFETLPLEEIQHLMADAENSEPSASPASCLGCGHSMEDHSIDNETCWFAILNDGAVKLCGCRGYRAFE